jgi:hypothetical protein
MIPYWVLFLAFAFPAQLTNEQSRQRTTVGFLAAGLILITTIGLRREVGGDWTAYDAIFNRLAGLNLVTALGSIEPAYALLNWGAANAGLEMWSVNLLCACIFTYGFLIFCRDQPNPTLAVLVGIPYLVIVVAMGYTRQGAALGLVMGALTYYSRGSIVRMAFSLAAAVMFHKSAIIVIPFIALASSQRRALTIVLLGVIAGLTYYLFVSATLDRLVTSYVTARYSSSGAGIRIAMNLIPASIYLLFWRRFQLDRDQRRLWMIFSAGSFVALLLLLTTPSSTAVDRVSLYLIPLQLFVLSRAPLVFSGGVNASAALKFAVILYSAAVQFVWLNYADNVSAWLPYRSYLFR